MRGEPILRSGLCKPSCEHYRKARITATGGLRYIKGNPKPHFTLTGQIMEQARNNRWMDGACGCIHRELLTKWPELKPLADLHLSDIDGVPMHAEANGWYQLAGALGGMGEKYHAGNGKVQHWKEDGAFDGYRESTPEECLRQFADYCRITIEAAVVVMQTVKLHANPRKRWGEFAEAFKPRWKKEADAAIAEFGLVVFGDPWTPAK